MLQQALISIVGIAFVVALAWLLFRRADGSGLSEAEALAAAENGLSGFRSRRAICGRQARGALVLGADERIALLKPHGDHVSARLLGPAARARHEGDILIVETGETMFGPARLDLGEAAARDWLKRIEGRNPQ